MSPEQIRGAKDVTAQSDIYSLGVTLYEVCVGESAFDGASDYEVMSDIVSGRLTKPEKLEALDPQLGQAIRKAMSVIPGERFATCEDFAQALLFKPAPTQPKAVQRTIPQTESAGSGPVASGPKFIAKTQRCPFCQEIILASAPTCVYCLEPLPHAVRPKNIDPGVVVPNPAAPVAHLVSARQPTASAIQSWPAPTENSLVPRNLSVVKSVGLSLLLPGLGQLMAEQHRLGGLILGAYCLLHYLDSPTALIVLAHFVGGLATALRPPLVSKEDS